MRNQSMFVFGALLILVGALFLLSNIFRIDLGAWCWPVGLIALGLFLLLRPRMVEPGTTSHFALIGDEDRVGPWAVAPEEHWFFINDIDIDLTRADVPVGETRIRLAGFISEAEVTLPAAVGLLVRSAAAVTSIDEVGQPESETLFAPVEWQSDGYKAAERRVRLETTALISEIKIRLV